MDLGELIGVPGRDHGRGDGQGQGAQVGGGPSEGESVDGAADEAELFEDPQDHRAAELVHGADHGRRAAA
jgi:hypothetical protein